MLASAVGRLDALTVDASLGARDLRSEAVSARRLDATVRLDGLGGSAPWARAWFGGTGIVQSGQPPWRADGAAGWRRAASEDRGTVSVRASRADGAVAALALDGAGAGERFAGRLSTLRVGLPGETAWALVAPARWRLADGVVSADRLALTAGSQRVMIEGSLGVPGRNAARVAIAALELGPICRQLGERPCGGTVAGTLTLGGTAAAPTLDGALRAAAVRVERETYGDVTLDVRYAGQRLGLRAQLVHADAGRLDADATIPLDLAWHGSHPDLRMQPVQIGLRTAGLDLGFVPLLVPRTLRRLDGRLTADLRLAGPWGALRGSGTAALSASAITLSATAVTYEGVEGRVRLDGDTLLIEQLDARAGNGTLHASGRLGLREGAAGGVAATIRLDRFLAVNLAAYRAHVSGTLRLAGSVPAPVIEGDIDVADAVIRPSVLPTSAPSLEADPTIEVVGLPPAAVEPAPPGPDLLDALTLGLRVRIERDAWIRRDDADIELAGDLQVTKTPQAPTLLRGRIRLVRGSYAFQGRRFTLERGVVIFDGENPPDPALQVEATHRAGDYRVVVALGGTATHPTLTLTSEPPLDQADILAVLLFGRPAHDLRREQSVDLQRQAVALAAGYVAPELRRSVMDAFGLDTLDLGATEVSAGRYLTQDIFLSISADFGAQPTQIVGVEYQLLPRVSVKVSTSSRGSSAIDLLWGRRY
ncbi:MAG: translocation/assembly module TamB [bacterium]|nr:translocation/assembly module TamB [bacterium]